MDISMDMETNPTEETAPINPIKAMVRTTVIVMKDEGSFISKMSTKIVEVVPGYHQKMITMINPNQELLPGLQVALAAMAGPDLVTRAAHNIKAVPERTNRSGSQI